MSRHVILLTDAHEAPAFELIEALRLAGLQTLIEGVRDIPSHPSSNEASSNVDAGWDSQPLAVLYEVVAGADIIEVQTAVEHSANGWPGTPLIACRRQLNNFHGQSWRSLDGVTLKRLGFRAIADKAAQLPAILHEIEGRGMTGELRLPEIVAASLETKASFLPARVSSSRLRVAFDLVASLHFTGDQTSAARTALAGLAPLVDADRWTIYLFSNAKEPEPAILEAVASVNRDDFSETDHAGEWRRLLLGEELPPVGSESRAARLAGAGMGTIKKRERRQNFIAVPLICGERILGVLEGVRQRRAFRSADVEMLNSLSLPLASALANAVRIDEAERLSQTDDLTKLHNARYLRQFLLNEIRRARRYGSSVSSLFLDLDDFKRVNDAHGHLVGSHVLMEMAGVILSSIRDTDAVARYGGDEFVIVLPDTQMELAGLVAERIREKIAAHFFNGGRNLKLSLTASFGVATFPEHASSPQQLIAAADTAMYEAKAANKNCIRFATGVATRKMAVQPPGADNSLHESERKVFS